METYFTLANAIDMAHTISPARIAPGDNILLSYHSLCLALMVADHLTKGSEATVLRVGSYDEEIAPFGLESNHREMLTSYTVNITKN